MAFKVFIHSKKRDIFDVKVKCLKESRCFAFFIPKRGWSYAEPPSFPALRKEASIFPQHMQGDFHHAQGGVAVIAQQIIDFIFGKNAPAQV